MKQHLETIPEYTLSYGDVDYHEDTHKREVLCLGEITHPDIEELLHDLGYHAQTRDGLENANALQTSEDEDKLQPRRLRRIKDKEIARLSYQLPW